MVQDHFLKFSCSIHLNFFYTIFIKLFFQFRQYCLSLMNGGHTFLSTAFRFWKVTQNLTSALLQSNILSPSKTVRLVTNIWPPFINNRYLTGFLQLCQALSDGNEQWNGSQFKGYLILFLVMATTIFLHDP